MSQHKELGEMARMDSPTQSEKLATASPVAPDATAGAGVALPHGPLVADDLDNLRHMLGVSDKCRRGYRNYFVAGGVDVNSMERLRSVGFVVKNERYALSDAPCYHATIEGARAVGLKALPR